MTTTRLVRPSFAGARPPTRVHGEVGLRRAPSSATWTSVLEQRSGATPFHAWDWLEWVAPLLQCRFLPLVIVDDTDTSVGVLPLLLKRRGPFQTANWVPFPYLGPVVPPDLLGPTLDALRRIGRRERLVDLQLASHPLAPDPLDSGAIYAAHGIEQHLDETYIIALAGRDLAEVQRGLSRTARQKLRQLDERGVQLRPSTADEITEILPVIDAAALERQGLKSAYGDDLGRTLAGRPPAVTMRITSAVVDGITVGVLATLGGPITLTWMGGILDKHRETNANIALFWDAISWAHRSGSHAIDLVGVPTPGIANFKKQFGGTLHRYPVGHHSASVYPQLRRLHRFVDPVRAGSIRRRSGAPGDSPAR